MIITELTPLDHQKQRVCIDGFYTFPLYLSEIKKYRLSEGMNISEEKLESIKIVLRSRLYERILYYLTDSDHSERDIRRKMHQAGYPEDIIDDCIIKLKGYKLIDDERYATTYAHMLADGHQKNKTYIRNKLFEKGISKELIERVLDELEIDETELILQALRKKKCSPADWNELDQKNKQKIYASLLRQGFKTDSIQHVLHMSYND